MADVTTGKRAAPGRHAGAPVSEERPDSQTGSLLLLALGITAAVVAWGYLVYLAIDFGSDARNGDSYNVSLVKFWLEECGHPFGPPRPPQRRLADAERAEFTKLLAPARSAEATLIRV